jgi:hypothetical protein
VQQLPATDSASGIGLNHRVFSEWVSEGRAFKSHRPDHSTTCFLRMTSNSETGANDARQNSHRRAGFSRRPRLPARLNVIQKEDALKGDSE